VVCAKTLLGATAATVLAAALGSACDDGSATAPTAEAIRGVWAGTVAVERAGGSNDLCIDFMEVGPGAAGDASVGGEIYIDGELRGLIAGAFEREGLLIFGGSSAIGVYSGKLDGDRRVGGTWVQTSAAQVPEFGPWSAEKTGRASCA
jgi:hypothetical protein